MQTHPDDRDRGRSRAGIRKQVEISENHELETEVVGPDFLTPGTGRQ